jgi:hypothetical protein
MPANNRSIPDTICKTDGCRKNAERLDGRCDFHYRKNLPGKRCTVDGCDQKQKAYKMCSKHGQRWKKYGDPLKTERVRIGVGATKKNAYGYVLEFLPDHPASRNSDGWVMQHRRVMSDYLGRPLESFENVHHKNGVRDDNRIENLELWVVRQPYGQRVEDLLDYADWIISRYRR